MSVTHIVLFAYKPETTKEEIKEVREKFLALQQQCKTADNGPLVQSFHAGSNNSTEGLSGKINDAFVMTFASKEDRDYYNEKDQAHKEFKDFVLPKLIPPEARIVDFTPGVFE
ncbi:uncharacterized protein L969DRAFT_104153 [Mixia osmundae IAM 14324]|uniref:Stress-response A/B barrel domain-containing protein n=1 Tax=Mixia osmundae (strain CBS 9802 / IAM 14324 / JCM 22182 / KY 12970) TaxID=764103 RepID=G7DZ44_MIXOS|nr:uncharacterized protein L969DRAFT_104153 [Mixia osmundae IAM 14324]KEI38255.1 hypothetical protein L969DRAFT_104153 [Mixia osmundae IAM 14324]GAA95854.1 hypothetical protein E5Q_02511 [Mixia osmundae IAM 14324]